MKSPKRRQADRAQLIDIFLSWTPQEFHLSQHNRVPADCKCAPKGLGRADLT